METIKFGLLLSIIPFTAIFLIITIWWALVDMSLQKITGTKRTLWTLAVILLPPFGALAYNYFARNQVAEEGYTEGFGNAGLATAAEKK